MWAHVGVQSGSSDAARKGCVGANAFFILLLLLGCSTTKKGMDAPGGTFTPALPSGSVGTTGGGTGVSCGPQTCAPGLICCNASCGICTPPDGMCIQTVCGQTSGHCTVDADCRLVSNYCEGCNCLALTRDDQDPACGSGKMVACLVDPCQTKRAVCATGTCAPKAK